MLLCTVVVINDAKQSPRGSFYVFEVGPPPGDDEPQRSAACSLRAMKVLGVAPKVDFEVSLHDELEKNALKCRIRHKYANKGALDVVNLLPQTSVSMHRPNITNHSTQGYQTWSAGMFVHGGVVGVTNTCYTSPEAAKYLTALVRSRIDYLFRAIGVFQGVSFEVHKDKNNDPNSVNIVIPLRKHGGVWVEDPFCSSDQAMWKQVPTGASVKGRVLKAIDGVAVFPPNRWHASLEGCNRLVLVAWSPKSFDKLSEQDSALLDSLGFPVRSLLGILGPVAISGWGERECEESGCDALTVDLPKPSVEVGA